MVSEIELRNFLKVRSLGVEISKCIHAWDFSFSSSAALIFFHGAQEFFFLLVTKVPKSKCRLTPSIISVTIHTAGAASRGLDFTEPIDL